MDPTAGLALAAGVMLAASGWALWWRGRQGRARPAAVSPATGQHLAALGILPGTPATLLQFSSAFCAPCRATRVICAQIAGQMNGVRHLDIDAEAHLEQVRALGVWRTPTVFVIDPAGRIITRIIGRPTRDQVRSAVGPLLSGRGEVSHA